MRTFLFKEYLDSENGRFFPVETYNSEEFGRTFMIDDNLEFLSAPLLKSGKYDEQQVGYVSEWTEWEGVNMDKLLGIYRTKSAQFHYNGTLQQVFDKFQKSFPY